MNAKMEALLHRKKQTAVSSGAMTIFCAPHWYPGYLILPAEGNIGGKLVNLSLVSQAFTVPGEKFRAFIVWVNRVAEAVRSPFEPNERLVTRINTHQKEWPIQST